MKQNKTRWRYLAVALLIGTCWFPALETACSSTSKEPEPGAMAMAAAPCTPDACAYVTKHKGDTVQTKYLSCCLALMLTACPVPNPVNPIPDGGTGGSYATGGSAGTGGKVATGGNSAPSADAYTKCVAAKTKDSHVQNVAQKTGESVSWLANTICSDPVILEAYQ